MTFYDCVASAHLLLVYLMTSTTVWLRPCQTICLCEDDSLKVKECSALTWLWFYSYTGSTVEVVSTVAQGKVQERQENKGYRLG